MQVQEQTCSLGESGCFSLLEVGSCTVMPAPFSQCHPQPMLLDLLLLLQGKGWGWEMSWATEFGVDFYTKHLAVRPPSSPGQCHCDLCLGLLPGVVGGGWDEAVGHEAAACKQSSISYTERVRVELL